MKHTAVLAGLALAIAAFTFSCSPDTAQNSSGSELVVEKGDPKAAMGKRLFNENCASCHHPSKDVTGPALKGARARWGNDTARLHAFVHNSQQVINSGDAYAKKLYEEYDETMMTPFPQLSGEEIEAILNYVENYGN